MLFGGIDPGKEGALAIIDSRSQVRLLVSTPMFVSASGRPEYDLPVIAELLRTWSRKPEALVLAVEKLHPLPRTFNRAGGAQQHGGTIANFNRGLAHGWRWMAAGMGIPCLMVTPQVWQREMLEGHASEDTKARSLAAASRLWPSLDLRRSKRATKPCDAYSDALLLSEYGRRQHMGGAVFASSTRAAGA